MGENQLSKNEVSLLFTAQWYSFAHKQQDDLSFSLYAKGSVIFDDAGYSDYLDRRMIKKMSLPWGHNTCFVDGEKYVKSDHKGLTRTTSILDHGKSQGIIF